MGWAPACLQRLGGEGDSRGCSRGALRPAVGAAGSPGGAICWFPWCDFKQEEGEDVLPGLTGVNL